MTSGDVFHKIRFLVIDKVGDAASGLFRELHFSLYTADYADYTDSVIFFIHPPCSKRIRNMMPRKVSSMAIAVQTPGNP